MEQQIIKILKKVRNNLRYKKETGEKKKNQFNTIELLSTYYYC